MEYRQFGKTGLTISAIGFGCWEIGGTYGRIDEDEFRRAVPQAIESGINIFDTAEAYGMGVSEEALARALGCLPRHQIRRRLRRDAEPPRQQPGSRHGVDRKEPAEAADRPCRRLSRPLARPLDTARRDNARARRHRAAGQ